MNAQYLDVSPGLETKVCSGLVERLIRSDQPSPVGESKCNLHSVVCHV